MKKRFHSAAAHCEALPAELRQEKQRPQNNDEPVDGDPLLVQLKDVAQQSTLYHFQLEDRTSQHHLLLGLEDLVHGINVTDPLCHPL